MKQSELRRLIREEVRKITSEVSDSETSYSTTGSTRNLEPPQKLIARVEEALPKLEKLIEEESKKVQLKLTKRQANDYNSRFPYKRFMMTRKGIKELKELIDVYDNIVSYTNIYSQDDASDNYAITKKVYDYIQDSIKKYNL